MKSGFQKIIFFALIIFAAKEISAADLAMARFAGTKEAQVRELSASLTNKVPSLVWRFFDAVRVDNWDTVTNLAAQIMQSSGAYTNSVRTEFIPPALKTAIWPPISETIGAYEQFHEWDNKLLHVFGSNIISSIPRGSIYFGGTDPGRFVISALSESQPEGKPFFILTQNQLVDERYLDYLRTMFGNKIYIPTVEEVQNAFLEYTTNARARLDAGKLKPGEDVGYDAEGKVQVRGAVSVMEINGLLAEIIWNKNPDQQFYIEESFPLDWMYPYLSPHGLIMQLNHQPVTVFDESMVQAEQNYWNRFVGRLIGNWLTDKTSIKEICDFAEKTYLQKNFDGFTGDMGFAKNDMAQKAFSKLRSSLGGLYAWRADYSKDNSEKARLRQAADLAFQQSFALCPYSPEAVFRYVNFLEKLNRPDDAMRIAKTAMHISSENQQFESLFKQLEEHEGKL